MRTDMNSEYDLFPGTRPSAKDFDPLKAQFRRAEIYKLALQRAINWHNYEGHVNLSLRNIPYHEMDIDYMINDAKMEIDNGK